MASNILIAEDEEFISKLYKYELEQHEGITVTCVPNGKRAIEEIQKGEYSLLLLDLLMPDMDGYTVLTELQRKKVKLPLTVVLTNLSQEVDRNKCMELGAKDYLIKSDTGAEELWEKIQAYL